MPQERVTVTQHGKIEQYYFLIKPHTKIYNMEVSLSPFSLHIKIIPYGENTISILVHLKYNLTNYISLIYPFDQPDGKLIGRRIPGTYS